MLTPGRYRVLAAFTALEGNKGPVTLQSVADRLSISKTTIYEHIQYLLKDGVLEAEVVDPDAYHPRHHYHTADRCPACGQEVCRDA